jgi:xanthine dehydrogenase YagS FAD-binding subunit
VEVCARLGIADGKFQLVRVVAGGIAPVPLRLTACERTLQSKPAVAAVVAEAAKQAASGAKPLPMTIYKLDVLEGLVRDLLERLVA